MTNIIPETVCDAINDMKSSTESMAIINYIDALTARIRELEAEVVGMQDVIDAMKERDC